MLESGAISISDEVQVADSIGASNSHRLVMVSEVLCSRSRQAPRSVRTDVGKFPAAPLAGLGQHASFTASLTD